MPHPAVDLDDPQDWRPLFDHELNLLPENYRAVIVACDLEGRSRKEAARHRGVSEGTISSRLARGRCLLAKRLSRYGLSLSAGALAAAIAEGAASAVPSPLVSATLRAVSGQGAVSASIDFLVKGALKTMLLTKLKLAVGAVMIVAALGASGLAYQAADQNPSAPVEKRGGGKPQTDLESLRQEVELLKLKVEVVEQKLRAQDAEMRGLRTGAAEGVKERAKTEPHFTPPQVLEFERQAAGKNREEYQRRYESQLRQNRIVPGSIPKDEVEATRLQRDNFAYEEKTKAAAVKWAWRRQRERDIENAVKVLLYAGDAESRQRAADSLEKAVQKYLEEMKK
jgi:hypothetical protein